MTTPPNIKHVRKLDQKYPIVLHCIRVPEEWRKSTSSRARNIQYNKSFLFGYRKVRNLLFLILGHHINIALCVGTISLRLYISWRFSLVLFRRSVSQCDFFFVGWCVFSNPSPIQFTAHYSSQRIAFKCCFSVLFYLCSSQPTVLFQFIVVQRFFCSSYRFSFVLAFNTET